MRHQRLLKTRAPACANHSTGPNGGDGALELADAVIDACNETNDFKFLYPLRK